MTKDLDNQIRTAERIGYRIDMEFCGPLGSGKTTRANWHADTLRVAGADVIVLDGLISPDGREMFDVVMVRKSGRH